MAMKMIGKIRTEVALTLRRTLIARLRWLGRVDRKKAKDAVMRRRKMEVSDTER